MNSLFFNCFEQKKKCRRNEMKKKFAKFSRQTILCISDGPLIQEHFFFSFYFILFGSSYFINYLLLHAEREDFFFFPRRVLNCEKRKRGNGMQPTRLPTYISTYTTHTGSEQKLEAGDVRVIDDNDTKNGGSYVTKPGDTG